MQLLLDPSKNACNTACDIIARIVNENQTNESKSQTTTIDELKKTSSAMIKPTVDLIVDIYSQKYPQQTFQFLLEQFELVSECDSNPNSGEVSQIRLFFFAYIPIQISHFYFYFKGRT